MVWFKALFTNLPIARHILLLHLPHLRQGLFWIVQKLCVLTVSKNFLSQGIFIMSTSFAVSSPVLLTVQHSQFHCSINIALHLHFSSYRLILACHDPDIPPLGLHPRTSSLSSPPSAKPWITTMYVMLMSWKIGCALMYIISLYIYIYIYYETFVWSNTMSRNRQHIPIYCMSWLFMNCVSLENLKTVWTMVVNLYLLGCHSSCIALE